ncbi:MAG: acetoin:2,6-dichlorophenolindophenol oxidoreductase subunit alpha [Mycobacteriales bacterium]
MDLSELYAQMCLIRAFEEALLEVAARGEVPGVVHPYTGHEAVAVGAVAGRRPDEWVVGYYRCHGHAIASGSPIGPLLREMLDRAGGICGGKSGSMQICDRDRRFLLASSIVGSQLPIAAGVAFGERAAGSGRAVVVFCGDGALGAGVAYETLMIARQKGLPLALVCEDNGWQDRNPSPAVMPMKPAELLRGLGVEVTEADGNDVEQVASAMSGVLDVCRAGGGPAALVARTYLRDFHSQLRNFVPAAYRPADQVERWKAKDPLLRAGQRLRSLGTDPQPVLDAASAAVAEAVRGALAAPPTPVDTALSSVTVAPFGAALAGSDVR